MMIATYVPQGAAIYSQSDQYRTLRDDIYLFLIGSGMSWKSLKEVGARPYPVGCPIWIII